MVFIFFALILINTIAFGSYTKPNKENILCALKDLSNCQCVLEDHFCKDVIAKTTETSTLFYMYSRNKAFCSWEECEECQAKKTYPTLQKSESTWLSNLITTALEDIKNEQQIYLNFPDSLLKHEKTQLKKIFKGKMVDLVNNIETHTSNYKPSACIAARYNAISKRSRQIMDESSDHLDQNEVQNNFLQLLQELKNQ